MRHRQRARDTWGHQKVGEPAFQAFHLQQISALERCYKCQSWKRRDPLGSHVGAGPQGLGGRLGVQDGGLVWDVVGVSDEWEVMSLQEGGQEGSLHSPNRDSNALSRSWTRAKCSAELFSSLW